MYCKKKMSENISIVNNVVMEYFHRNICVLRLGTAT